MTYVAMLERKVEILTAMRAVSSRGFPVPSEWDDELDNIDEMIVRLKALAD